MRMGKWLHIHTMEYSNGKELTPERCSNVDVSQRCGVG